MIEEVLVTARFNAKVDPALSIWSWEIAVYLFLGGLTAGIMCFAAWAQIARKGQQLPFARDRFALLAPIVLSVGMTTLFLDLEHKLYVFRFYTSFQPASPMSWGSWILVLVYPVMLLQVLSTLRRGYPVLATRLSLLPFAAALLDYCERLQERITYWALPLGVALGIYTGILLSTFSARPFWNSGVLGPLFLVSGLSTAAALAIIGSRDVGEKRFFVRADILLISVELVLVALFLISLGSGAEQRLAAVQMVTGGGYTVQFWLWFLLPGLMIPLVLEVVERQGWRDFPLIAPLLVLYGGFMLRYVTLELGQHSTWTDYALQFDPQLLLRLTP